MYDCKENVLIDSVQIENINYYKYCIMFNERTMYNIMWMNFDVEVRDI